MDPRKVASPKAKIPPSEATSQYPPPSRVVVIATMGRSSGRPPIDPWKAASP